MQPEPHHVPPDTCWGDKERSGEEGYYHGGGGRGEGEMRGRGEKRRESERREGRENEEKGEWETGRVGDREGESGERKRG